MLRRIVVVLFVIAGFAVAAYVAVQNAAAAASSPIAATMLTGTKLLFNSGTWLVWLALFAGVFAGAVSRRRPDAIEGVRVRRHDGVAMSEHWSHALGTILLLGSGFALGAKFLPAATVGAYQDGVALNLHFVGAVVFCFGATFYATNALLTGRWKGHIPHEIGAALKGVVAHYTAVFSGSELPPEDKYFGSEHLSYPVAIVGGGLMLLTGVIKVAAHSLLGLPGWLLGPATWVHDVTALVMGLFLITHVIAGALVPWSWPLLGSMFTGYVTTDYVEHHHKDWYAQLKGVKDK